MFQYLSEFYQDWRNLVYVLLILVVTLLVTVVVHFALRKRYLQSSARHVWRDAAIGALGKPLMALIWITGLSLVEGALTVGGQLQMVGKFFPPVRDMATIAVLVWYLFRFVQRLEQNIHARARLHEKEIDATAADAIGKLARAIIVAAAVLVAMQSLGFSIASVLAFGGVAGIAVGLAAQGLVANLLGGITIYASRPFKVGEYIIFPGTQLMGEVQHIGWRATRILGFDRKPFYVPNAKFNTETIINHSRLTSRCIQEYVYLRLDDIDKVPAVVADINCMIAEHPEVEHDFFVFNFDSYDKHAVKLLLYAFTVGTAYTDYMRVKEDLLLKIAATVRQHGAQLAVPVSAVYMPEGLALQRHYSGTEASTGGTESNTTDAATVRST